MKKTIIIAIILLILFLLYAQKQTGLVTILMGTQRKAHDLNVGAKPTTKATGRASIVNDSGTTTNVARYGEFRHLLDFPDVQGDGVYYP